ncbi:MAG TPA: cysteine desulfurase [Thermoflexales bacterium]|nr:cysteine desulfurase [Thermoflexales bacterium]HQZ23467.1 cysteine desulfurase [Thermoflexales bacterium]
MYDLKTIRKDFPALDERVNGKPLVFLDSAASSQKPIQVLNAMDEVYRTTYANVHRGVYQFSDHATQLYDAARAKIARFIGAPAPENVVFTRNATEALNLLAYSYAPNALKAGDEIILTELEHHANFVPWVTLAKQHGWVIKFVPLREDGLLDWDKLDELLTPRTKLVCFAQVSNVLGSITDAKAITQKAHAAGAKVVVDGAQSAPHMPVDVQDMGCDFFVFSGHKMLGPTGIGALYGKMELLETMPPFLMGGDMISYVGFDKILWNDVPLKFEAGTPAFVEAIGLGAAVDYLSALGMAAVREHEREITSYALERMGEVPGARIFGPHNADVRGGVLTFAIDRIHPHDLGTLLDEEGVAIRAGHHCAQPLHIKLGVNATARASFYVYTVKEEVDALIAAIYAAKGKLKK